MMKHILCISSWYPNQLQPTNGDFIKRQMQAVAKLCKVSVLHIVYNSEISKRTECIHNEQNNLNEYIVYYKLPNFLYGFKHLFVIYLYILWFKRISKKYGKPDIVHAHIIYPIGIIALLFKLRFSVPFVLGEQSPQLLHKNIQRIPPPYMALFKIITRQAQRVIAVNSLLAESMQNAGLLGEYAVVGNLVETDVFTLKPIEESDRVQFLHVSTLDTRSKNVEGILRAFKQALEVQQNMHLTFVSENSFYSLQQLVKELQIEQYITWEEYKSQEDLVQLYENSHCFILFSNYEVFSCGIAESLSVGRPVICTNTAGIASYISENMGLIIPPQDEEQLTQAIITMSNTYTNYKAEELHAFVKNTWSSEIIGMQIVSLYKNNLK